MFLALKTPAALILDTHVSPRGKGISCSQQTRPWRNSLGNRRCQPLGRDSLKLWGHIPASEEMLLEIAYPKGGIAALSGQPVPT